MEMNPVAIEFIKWILSNPLLTIAHLEGEPVFKVYLKDGQRQIEKTPEQLFGMFHVEQLDEERKGMEQLQAEEELGNRFDEDWNKSVPGYGEAVGEV